MRLSTQLIFDTLRSQTTQLSSMWRKTVEAILKESYETALRQIRAINDGASEETETLVSTTTTPLKCEAIIAKGRRENQRCNSRVQPGSLRCKTHSKNAKAIAPAVAPEEPLSTLVSALDGETSFATREADGTVVFSALPEAPEQLFY